MYSPLNSYVYIHWILDFKYILLLLLSEITDNFRNNPKTTLILGGDLNAGGIDWETGLVPDDSPNRLLKEKLIEVISKAGL